MTPGSRSDALGTGGVLKRILVGRALTSHAAEHQLMPKVLALPVFASDQLSSVAYATEEMMLVLLLIGTAGMAHLLPLGIAVAVLLILVIASYRQTVHAYPRGGGSYIVARDNLGTMAGLTAAAAILTSYVLTVAVSVTAGSIAVTSAIPSLAGYRVPLAIGFILLITVANLRGAKEAGRLFAVPTYGFVVVVAVTLGVGFWRCVTEGCPTADSSELPVEATAGLTLLLLLRAFSSGATALTGVEAIADGVQAFRRPQARNAADTLLVMGVLSIPMFLGITVLARLLNVRTSEELSGSTSVLAQIGDSVFDGGIMFLTLQVFTGLILILAANTAYQDFPRLSSILARDRFMPSQFRNRGDRLVYSNGIAVLALLAAALVWVFEANLSRLIQLYVVGVFTALTLSQAGMVRRWYRVGGERWRRKAALNVVGAAATGLALSIVVVTRFTLGAWMVIAVVPFVIAFFLAVHRHYERTGAKLRAQDLAAGSSGANVMVLLVRDLGPATTRAITYLLAMRPEHLVPLHVGDREAHGGLADRWGLMAPNFPPLERLDAPERKERRALRAYLRGVSRPRGGFVTLVIPEEVERGRWREYLRGRSDIWLKASLMFEPGLVVTDVPLAVGATGGSSDDGRPLEPRRSVVLVPVSDVHDATIRAVDYAVSLRPTSVQAIFFAPDPEDVAPVVEAWSDRQLPIPLVVADAPFRDVGQPLLEEVRSHTRKGDTMVTVVLPEFVVERWWEHLLHNQTGLYFKRLLLFEPWVVVTSVPFHLDPASQASEAASAA